MSQSNFGHDGVAARRTGNPPRLAAYATNPAPQRTWFASFADACGFFALSQQSNIAQGLGDTVL